MTKYFLAVDIGTTTAKHTVGWTEDGKLRTKVVYSFTGYLVRRSDGVTWNLGLLRSGLLDGMRAAFRRYPSITSVSIDGMGSDYVLMNGDEVIPPSFSYLFDRTQKAIYAVHEKIPFRDLYMATGVSFQPYNTLYQLYEDRITGRLKDATDFLMIPDYLVYVLTGRKVSEYTVATTTGLVNLKDRDYDAYTLAMLRFQGKYFRTPQMPGTVIGKLRPEVEKAVGGNTDVVLCASHSTASAVYGLAADMNEPYLLIGEWAQMGCRKRRGAADYTSMYSGFSNEGGADGVLYVKNTMGLWVISELMRNWPQLTMEKVEKLVKKSTYGVTLEISDRRFVTSRNMRRTFDEILTDCPPRTVGDYFRCAFMSLVRNYEKIYSALLTNCPNLSHTLRVVGEGAKIDTLCELISKNIHVNISRMPYDAASAGNLKFQMDIPRGT
ncbi:MAG: hypothetical protein LUD29_01825 [Clostridia bacterium]|nr:hypothetical protein [Clostridia bacterium]